MLQSGLIAYELFAMLPDETKPNPRINARPMDAFDLFNFKHYADPNPYLETAALTVDLAMTGYLYPWPLPNYLAFVIRHYSQLSESNPV